MVVVRALEVRVLGGIAYLQHGHVLSVVDLLHVHVVAFAFEGQDHITGRQGQEVLRGVSANWLFFDRLTPLDFG